MLFSLKENVSRNSPDLLQPPLRVTQTTLIATLWSGIGVAFLFLIVRIWIKLKIFHRIQPDDYLVMIAWLMAVANVAIWTGIRHDLYLDQILTSGSIEELPPTLIHRIKKLIRGNLSAQIIAYTGLWSAKLSFVLFFHQLRDRHRWQQLAWWATLGFIVASYIVCVGTIDYRCLNISETENIIYNCTGHRTTRFGFITLYVGTALDITTNLLIILLSVNFLWAIRLNLKSKIRLSVIICLAATIMVTAIVRIYNASSAEKVDLTWLVLWGGAELVVVIIIASLVSYPMLYKATHTAAHGNYPLQHRASYKNEFNPITSELPPPSRLGNVSVIASGRVSLDTPMDSDGEPLRPSNIYVQKDIRIEEGPYIV